MFSVRTAVIASAATITLCGASIAATPITLTFEGVGNQAQINNFYNGGTDSQGNSGTNYGVQFGANTLALMESDPLANFSGEPTPSTVMFFLTGTAVLNYAPGFDTGFSFYFTTLSFTGVVRVYSGLNATGTLLGSISLPALGPGPDPANLFSNWRVGALPFSGIARSIDFGGTVNQVGYDNITFGSINPTVPEPASWLLFGIGCALLSASSLRRTRATEPK